MKILVILGPTATGKTDLALQLAKKFNGELVSCDSRQVYKGLDIGTGKISNIKLNNPPAAGQISNVSKHINYWYVDVVKIWMYDVVSPKKQYTVYDYVKDANGVIREIWEKGEIPIIVGGTGLYLKALLYGLPNLAIPVDKKLRKKLERLTKEQLQKKLREISPKKWESLNESDKQNPRRLIRVIELVLSKHKLYPSVASLPQDDKLASSLSDVLKIGLTTSREVLYKRADVRVVSRIKQGMIEEAKKLYANGLSLKRMRQLGLEYGVLADFLEGKVKNKDELIKIMQRKIHDFIRRQITWFKKEKDVHWFDINEQGYGKKIEKMVGIWYDNLNNATKN